MSSIPLHAPEARNEEFNATQQASTSSNSNGCSNSNGSNSTEHSIFQTSYKVGSLIGIPIRVHSFFFVNLALLMLMATSVSLSYFIYVTILFGPILAATVLLHELAHCIVTRRLGGTAHGILLWPLGGLALIGHASTPKHDLLIAIAGPLSHVPQFLFYLVLHAISWRIAAPTAPFRIFAAPMHHTWLAITAGACYMQVMLLCFNLLLPVYPLDGGRVVADALLLAGVEVKRAAWLLLLVATPLGIALGVYALMTWQMLLLLVAAWVLYQQFELFKSIREQRLSQHPLFNFDDALHRKQQLDQV